MKAGKFIVGTIVAAVVLHAFGYLIFNVVAEGFYSANMAGTGGAFREAQIQWAIILGNVAAGAVLTLAILNRSGASTLGGGAITGAVVGFLVWAMADYVYYGLANLWTLKVVVIDPFVEAIHWAVTGAVTGFILGKMSPKQT